MSANRKRRSRQPGSLLELRVRAEPRRRRIRLAVAVLVFSAVTAYGIHLGARQWPSLVDRALLRDGLFALKEIQMFGPFEAVSRPELMLRTGVVAGENLLGLDLGRIKRDVQMIPYVESAAVERILPHLLRIRVVERTPIAKARIFSIVEPGTTAGRLYYLDRHAAVMPAEFNTTPPGDPFAERELPMITGVSAVDIRPGDRAPDPVVRWALDLISQYERAPVRKITRLKTVDVSETGVLRATLGNGASVIFGTRDTARQLLRLGLLHEIGSEHGQKLVRVDLSIGNNCPSLWTSAETARDRSPAGRATSTTSDSDV